MLFWGESICGVVFFEVGITFQFYSELLMQLEKYIEKLIGIETDQDKIMRTNWF